MANISLGTTDVKICARALVNIGMKPVQDLDGDDDVTLACSLLYPMVKKEVLSMYPWWSTKGKKQLSRLTQTVVNEYQFAFALPSNRLSGPLALYSDGEVGATPFHEWDLFGSEVLSDVPEIWGDFQFMLMKAV